MPMTKEALLLWDELWKKLVALEDAKKVFDGVPSDLKPDYEGIISSIFSELQQLRATMDFLVNDAPVAFPSEQQITDLRTAVGQLAGVVHVNQAVANLVPIVTRVLNTWPVSG